MSTSVSKSSGVPVNPVVSLALKPGRESMSFVAGLFEGWVREATNKNDGPWVEAILRTTGNKKGDPWCASFVSVVAMLAYRGRSPLPQSASCDVLLSWAAKAGRLRRGKDDVRPNDVFLILAANGNITDAIHAGVVTAVNTDGTISTIEGNTNTDGSAEGWGVLARKRVRGPRTIYIDLP